MKSLNSLIRQNRFPKNNAHKLKGQKAFKIYTRKEILKTVTMKIGRDR